MIFYETPQMYCASEMQVFVGFKAFSIDKMNMISLWTFLFHS